MKACAAGGSSLPPTAPKERNRSATAPFNQYGAPGLGGAPELAEFEERVSPERLAGCTSDQKSGLQGAWRQSPFLVRPSLNLKGTGRQRIPSRAVCCFFRRSKPSDALWMQRVPSEILSLLPRTARRPAPTLPKSVHATRDPALRWSLMSATGESRSGV